MKRRRPPSRFRLTVSRAASAVVAASYLVESLGNLDTTNWQSLAQPATNTWSGAFSATQAQQFFRVWIRP